MYAGMGMETDSFLDFHVGESKGYGVSLNAFHRVKIVIKCGGVLDMYVKNARMGRYNSDQIKHLQEIKLPELEKKCIKLLKNSSIEQRSEWEKDVREAFNRTQNRINLLRI